MSQHWIEIGLELTERELPLVEAMLETLGVVSVECSAADETDELFQEAPGDEPLWGRLSMRALFEGGRAGELDVDGALSALLGRSVQTRRHRLDERDWVAGFSNAVQPLCIADRLHLLPHGHAAPAPPAVAVWLEPGLAFGSGTHPTTRLCLDWLVQAQAEDRLPRELVDYGCGSGVLALAALALGVERALAVDHDPQALLATRENGQRNGVPDTSLPVYAPETLPRRPVALILANILKGPLLTLAPEFGERVAPGGTLVLSGVLPEQMADLEAAYLPWFEPGPEAELDGWMCAEYRRRRAS